MATRDIVGSEILLRYKGVVDSAIALVDTMSAAGKDAVGLLDAEDLQAILTAEKLISSVLVGVHVVLFAGQMGDNDESDHRL